MAASNQVLPQVVPRRAEVLHERMLLAGVALCSFSALLLELALTRLFSVVLFYHFAFLAISIALLGLGAGGVFAHLWKQRLNALETRRIAMLSSAMTAILIPVVLEIVLHVPVSLRLSAGNFFRLSVVHFGNCCNCVEFGHPLQARTWGPGSGSPLPHRIQFLRPSRRHCLGQGR